MFNSDMSQIVMVSILIVLLIPFFFYFLLYDNETNYFDYRNRVKIPDMQKFVSQIYSPNEQNILIRTAEDFIKDPQYYSTTDKLKRILNIFNPDLKKSSYNVFKFDKLESKIYSEIRITKSKINLIESFERRVVNFVERNSNLDPKYLTNQDFEDLKKYLSEKRHALQVYLDKIHELLSHLNGIRYQDTVKKVSIDIANETNSLSK